MKALNELATPALILDRTRLSANLQRMHQRAAALGVALRPHMKTAKSAEVARLATQGQPGGITVSTLAEAAYFAERGFSDITYAVGIVPSKLDVVAAIERKTGARIGLLLDDAGTARAIAERAAALGGNHPVHIEIDTGQHRAGIAPDSSALPEIAGILAAGPATEVAGVLAHAGHSYDCRTIAEIETVAEAERAGAVAASEVLREHGHPCPVVSVGSTPTALHAGDLTGITEMRPGVYMFGDRFQSAILSCTPEDWALSVLATVIGCYPDRDLALIDAGGLALSQDRSMEAIDSTVSYGALYDATGRAPLEGVSLATVNQEHGFIRGRVGTLKVGQRVRVYPNHACMMAAMYKAYNVTDGADEIVAEWDRVNRW
jgi:D-serine deaminase-like pyridoxal phosphate-dependent protein